MTAFNAVCVYCGARGGADPRFAEAAHELGTAIARRGLRLVYGGATVGLMGLVAEAALEAGGEVVGVIPEALVRKEIAHQGLSELIVTSSMHTRKMQMADLADAFIALPGGIGTLEELFEIWTWAQLGFHRKPCGVLNVAGYYDHLVAFLDHARGTELLAPRVRDMLLVDDVADSLLDRCAHYDPPRVDRWIGRGQV